MNTEATNRNTFVKKILVVENDETNREYIILLLSEISHKFQITYAETGAEAVELFKQNSYDIILMNIVIPEITGFDATKEIRKADKKVSIIALSSIIETPAKFKNAGFNDYIVKPFTPDEFFAVFQKYFHT